MCFLYSRRCWQHTPSWLPRVLLKKWGSPGVPPAPLQNPLQPSTPALAGHPQGTCRPFPSLDTHFPGTMRRSRGSLPVVSAPLLLWGQMNVPGSPPTILQAAGTRQGLQSARLACTGQTLLPWNQSFSNVWSLRWQRPHDRNKHSPRSPHQTHTEGSSPSSQGCP